jgi:hypothetical protein
MKDNCISGYVVNRIRLFISLMIVFFCLSLNAQNKKALLIGISDYPQIGDDSWNTIHGVNDVELLSVTLKKQGFKISKLTDKRATANNIRKEFSSFVEDAKNGDVVYLHFSGHGQPVEDLDWDEDDGWDEALIPYDAMKKPEKGVYEGENHILDDELNTYLRDLRTKVGDNGFVYVVIDACHAGSSYRGEEEDTPTRGTNIGFSARGKLFTPPIVKSGRIKIEDLDNSSAICILEACRSYQVNSEIRQEDTFYGPLSFYINKVLQTNRLGKNIDWTDDVRKCMETDMRLIRQNMVIESNILSREP